MFLCQTADHCSSRGMATGSHFSRSPLGARARHAGRRDAHGADVLLEDGARCKTSPCLRDECFHSFEIDSIIHLLFSPLDQGQDLSM